MRHQFVAAEEPPEPGPGPSQSASHELALFEADIQGTVCRDTWQERGLGLLEQQLALARIGEPAAVLLCDGCAGDEIGAAEPLELSDPLMLAALQEIDAEQR